MTKPDPNPAPEASPAASTCRVTRRQAIAFLGLNLGLGAASSLARSPFARALAQAPAIAGPFESADFAALVPPDKKLSAAWTRSLFERGQRTVYSKDHGELSFIGMPVGGLCCGTLYIGGDGKLWLWDIFNLGGLGILGRSVPWSGFGQQRSIGPIEGSAYVAPHEQSSPLQQGFAIKVGGSVRPLDASGWSSITFNGEYPLARVEYRDPASPIAVSLWAYSPFVPLSWDDSSLPATICEFTLRNASDRAVQAEIAGWMENAACLHSAQPGSGQRLNAVQQADGATLVLSSYQDAAAEPAPGARPDILLEDFERPSYAPWRAEGDAFGSGPVAKNEVPGWQGSLGGAGERVVNSHASAAGADSVARDNHVGKLLGPGFKVERKYLSFLIGGGAGAGVGMRLLVGEKVVREAHGSNSNTMRRAAFEVGEFEGQTARLEIFDQERGAWGHTGADDIIQTDSPRSSEVPPTAPDRGTMALAMLGPARANADADPRDAFASTTRASARRPVGEPLTGSLARSVRLAPGQSQTVAFVVAWHFPNSGLSINDARSGNHYARRFEDASGVARHIARDYSRLSGLTKRWHASWYGSTLPFWFLDRTMANASTLATTTSHRLGTGRFWAWEGVGCCEGTCTHVWHYAQAPARLFPEIERWTREYVDFGVALDASGQIGFRGEGTGAAVDGQCGRILGALREHQMSADGAFLMRVWPRVKSALEYMLRHDADADGLLDGEQGNTLDAVWFGKIAWLSSLFSAALLAGEEMALARGDQDFARRCRARFEKSRAAIERELFNGEYFIQIAEPGHESTLGTYQTCHIDQVHGQGWAWQVDLPRVLDRSKTLSALRALYKYNFAPDVGPFRRRHTSGRAYALAGEGGLLMATNPKGLERAFGNASDWQYGYFNECMSGFEHQAASHMIAEGLVLEGLAVTRAIHDRYHAARRNPWNEVECSDHYARAMASYGSFIAACGFRCDGPRGHIGWAPRLQQDDFRAAFTSSEAWGSISQQRRARTQRNTIEVAHGRLRLKTLAFELAEAARPGARLRVQVLAGRKRLASSFQVSGKRLLVTLAAEAVVEEGQQVEVVSWRFGSAI